MPATNSIPLALSFMEVGCKTNHPYYGSPLLIYINLPRAFAKHRRPSVRKKAVRPCYKRYQPPNGAFQGSFFGASTRSARVQARPPVAARRRSNSWEASGSIVVRSLIYLKARPGGPYVLWDVGSIRPKGQKNDFCDAEAIAKRWGDRTGVINQIRALPRSRQGCCSGDADRSAAGSALREHCRNC